MGLTTGRQNSRAQLVQENMMASLGRGLDIHSFQPSKLQQGGFSLIEVLIAVCILTIGILSVNAMQINAISGNLTAKHTTESTSWGSDRVESLLSLDYTDPALNDGDGDGDAGLNDVDANADGSMTSPDGEYNIFWNVSENSPINGVKTINVVINRQVNGLTKTVTMNYIKPGNV